MKYELNDVMTVAEASDRWGIPYDTLRSRIGGRTKSMQQDIEKSLREGTVKRYKAAGKQRYEWLITADKMVEWYGECPNEN